MSERALDDDLRQIIRDSLREMLPGMLATPDARSASPRFDGQAEPNFSSLGEVEAVSFRSDADVSAFVARLLGMFENPKSREGLRAGRIRFRLSESPTSRSLQPVQRVESGVVTESAVKRAAQSGAKLVLGSGAVITPLARDRARSAGVLIERES